MDQDITPDIQRDIIARRIALWRNTLFEATIDLRVANRFQDEELINIAKANITRAEHMIAGYQQELDALT